MTGSADRAKIIIEKILGLLLLDLSLSAYSRPVVFRSP
jgi:hypothetical protein